MTTYTKYKALKNRRDYGYSLIATGHKIIAECDSELAQHDIKELLRTYALREREKKEKSLKKKILQCLELIRLAESGSNFFIMQRLRKKIQRYDFWEIDDVDTVSIALQLNKKMRKYRKELEIV